MSSRSPSLNTLLLTTCQLILQYKKKKDFMSLARPLTRQKAMRDLNKTCFVYSEEM